MKTEDLTDCLQKCGVQAEAREEILSCARDGRTRRQLALLGAQRSALLDDLHRAQRPIDLMDYVIRSVETAPPNHSPGRSAP